uniref:Uncharacterized protein n=1 Tax=Aegilops tauschii subsp. strangulata TaxID=200361 RepID=A0A453G4R3_AEGTS
MCTQSAPNSFGEANTRRHEMTSSARVLDRGFGFVSCRRPTTHGF